VTIDRKILFLNRAIASVKSDRPPDALAGLSDRHRVLIERYRKQTSPLDQYINFIESIYSPELLIADSAGLSEDNNASDAQVYYQDILGKMNAQHARRRKDLK